MSVQKFGGDWTSKKLKVLSKYLRAYVQIFKSNPKARFLTTIYVDAFAGSGAIKVKRSKRLSQEPPLPGLSIHADAGSMMKGSPRVALEIDPPFDHYLFLSNGMNLGSGSLKHFGTNIHFSLNGSRLNGRKPIPF